MAVYAYGTPENEAIPFVYESLTNEKISRFLWSYFDNCDLNRLKNLSWQDMTEDEKNCWSHAHRLLNFKIGDWIMHINVPSWGLVTAAKICSEYFYQNPLPYALNDGRHCFEVDEVFTFDRNDIRVHPKFSSRLKLRGGLWQIYCEEEFKKSLENLKNKKPEQLPQDFYLSEEVKNILDKLTERIQANNPGKTFETFLAKVFRNVPGVTEVIENGFGWGTDHGADLIVNYTSTIIGDLTEEKTMVVQVKSYEGEHWDTKAVDQLKDAINKYNAASGMIITTGKMTETLDKKFNELVEEMKKNNISVFILAGADVTKFILKYWKEYSAMI